MAKAGLKIDYGPFHHTRVYFLLGTIKELGQFETRIFVFFYNFLQTVLFLVYPKNKYFSSKNVYIKRVLDKKLGNFTRLVSLTESI